MKQMPRSDSLILIVVSVVTVFTDLAVAVITGVIISALVYAWNSARNIYVTVENKTKTQKSYQLHGQLFFASISNFRELFIPANDPDDVVIDFHLSRVWDHSAIEAIDKLAEQYERLGKTLHLRGLSPDCKSLLHTARDLVEEDRKGDPHYRVVVDRH